MILHSLHTKSVAYSHVLSSMHAYIQCLETDISYISDTYKVSFQY